jgi:hypothetical protein
MTLCYCAECRYAKSCVLFIVMLNAISLSSVVMLNVIMLSVVAPIFLPRQQNPYPENSIHL